LPRQTIFCVGGKRQKLQKQTEQNRHKIMKKSTIAVILVGGAILAAQSAFAQFSFVPDDLYMGFQNQAGSATTDYIINLGAASGIVGSNSVVDLSADFSLTDFDAVLGASPSMFGGVVSGNQNTPDIYATQLRSGGPGNPAVPGSTMSSTPTRTTDANAASALSQLNGPAAGTTGLLDTTKTWEAYVEPTLSASSFYGNTGVNPDSAIGSGGILYEDLWYNKNTKLTGGTPWNYEGYFTLNLSGGGPSLTFTPVNAPPALVPPVFTSVKKSGGTVTLIWTTVSNYTYQLEFKTNLTQAAWSNIGSGMLSISGLMTNTDSPGSDPHRFYQVQAH
jgi:hypothetical protein